MRYFIDLIADAAGKRRPSSTHVPNWNLVGITFSILPRYLLNVNLRHSLWAAIFQQDQGLWPKKKNSIRRSKNAALSLTQTLASYCPDSHGPTPSPVT